jgi:hypothetical protein
VDAEVTQVTYLSLAQGLENFVSENDFTKEDKLGRNFLADLTPRDSHTWASAVRIFTTTSADSDCLDRRVLWQVMLPKEFTKLLNSRRLNRDQVAGSTHETLGLTPTWALSNWTYECRNSGCADYDSVDEDWQPPLLVGLRLSTHKLLNLWRTAKLRKFNRLYTHYYECITGEYELSQRELDAMLVLDCPHYSLANFAAKTADYVFHKQLWWNGEGTIPHWYSQAFPDTGDFEQASSSSGTAPTPTPAPAEDLMTMAMALAKTVLGRSVN